jgi:hypothetical protein
MYAESETLVAAFPAAPQRIYCKWRAAFEVDNRVAEKYLCIQVYLLENRQRKQEKCCFARHQMANTLSAFQINFLKPTPRQRQIKKLTLFHYSLHFGSAASHIDLRALFPILCFILSHRDAGLVALNKGGPNQIYGLVQWNKFMP